MSRYENEILDPMNGPPMPAPLPLRPAHPQTVQVERFLRGELTRTEVRAVVRHLLTRCPQCLEVASRLWSLGDPVPPASPGAVWRWVGGPHD